MPNKPDSNESEPSLYYDIQGRPISMEQWLEKYQDHKSRRVGFFSGRWVRVSTVYLGIDHGMGMGGEPIIFETMVFHRFPPLRWMNGIVYDVDMARYSTLTQAKSGHLDYVHKWAGWRGFLGLCVIAVMVFSDFVKEKWSGAAR